MPDGRSPTVRRRRLGIELRRLREAAGLTIDQVANELYCSTSKISRIETGHVPASLRDVRDFLTIYEAPAPLREELMQLAREARQRDWWYHEYGDLPVVPLIGLQDAATSIRTYQQILIPGLLQIEDYARAVLRAILLDNPEEAERRVELRMTRQRLLGRTDAPNLWAVLDEAMLHRAIGKPGIMYAQIRHLIEVASAPNITLQVLPFSHGEHPALDSGFSIVGFADPLESDIVNLEHITGDLYLKDATSVKQYTLLFDHLRARALSPNDSAAFLANVANQLKKGAASGSIARGMD